MEPTITVLMIAERDSDGEAAAEGVIEPHHFEADENQDQREPVLQHVEAIHGAGQQEEHGAQTQDGEYIRGVDDEGLARDTEDGGHGINREEQVGSLEEEQHDHERRDVADCRRSSPESVRRDTRV